MNFIVFEGICKVGKTTLARQIGDLNPSNIYCHGNFSNSERGQQFRSFNERNFPFCILDVLYVSDLLLHTNETIKPALKQSSTIIQDRYVDSLIAFSRAYSWYFNEKIPNIEEIIQYYIKKEIILLPNLIVYVEANYNTLIERLKLNNSFLHEFYLNNTSFLKRVIEEYETIIEEYKRKKIKIIRINTTTNKMEDNVQRIYDEIGLLNNQ